MRLFKKVGNFIKLPALMMVSLGLGLSLLAPAQAEDIYKYHEVAAGETVYSIATAYHVPVAELLRCNSQTLVDCRGLQIGAILIVPVSQAIKNAEPAPAAKSSQAGKKPGTASAKAKVKRHGRRSLASNYQSSVSKAYSSSGDSVTIPAYVPAFEEEDGGAVSLNSRSGRPIRSLLGHARRFMGVPYVWGGTSPDGFDCSGYVQYVYALVGVKLPRTADVQYNCGRAVSAGSEAPGDMVFFETYAPGASHVGIYVGDNNFIHASSSGCVRISSLQEDYFRQHYLGAKRVL